MNWKSRHVKCWGGGPTSCSQAFVISTWFFSSWRRAEEKEPKEQDDEDVETLNDIKSTQNFECCFSQEVPSACYLFV